MNKRCMPYASFQRNRGPPRPRDPASEINQPLYGKLTRELRMTWSREPNDIKKQIHKQNNQPPKLGSKSTHYRAEWNENEKLCHSILKTNQHSFLCMKIPVSTRLLIQNGMRLGPKALHLEDSPGRLAIVRGSIDFLLSTLILNK